MIDIAHKVICSYCKMQFDRDKEPFVQVAARRYAHSLCAKNHNLQMSEIASDQQKLENYILKLFNIEVLSARIRKQIKDYVNEYGYTYSGILGTLTYWYEVKKNDTSKANNGIGIVPYIYTEAKNYYGKISQANKVNEEKINEDFVPPVIDIVIPVPQRNIEERKLFSFFDEDIGEE